MTKIVSPTRDKVRAWNRTDRVGNVTTDVALEDAKADDARAEDFDALVPPGG